jgi:CO/xanthine dehydrogenase FAD-binding subunit
VSELLRPRSLADALTMLRDEGTLVPLAGGTDLFVALNAGHGRAARYLDLWDLDELRGIRRDGRWLTLGALTTFTDCIRSKKIARRLPILAEAAREIGGVQIQNRGTLAGNIGNGSPAGDSLPVLAAAGAIVVLASRSDGEREVPLDEFYTGYRATVRRPDELIVRLRIKVPRGRQLFRKVGTRAAQAISKVVMASIGNRIAFGSVAPTVVRARKVEAYLDGGGADLEEAQRLLGEEIAPIDDLRSTADYRRRVAANLLAELFGN